MAGFGFAKDTSEFTVWNRKSPYRTWEQSKVFDFSDVSPVEAPPSLVLRGFAASLLKGHKRFSCLIPRSFEFGLHSVYVSRASQRNLWHWASSSRCRKRAGRNQGAQKAFKDEKAKARSSIFQNFWQGNSFSSNYPTFCFSRKAIFCYLILLDDGVCILGPGWTNQGSWPQNLELRQGMLITSGW